MDKEVLLAIWAHCDKMGSVHIVFYAINLVVKL